MHCIKVLWNKIILVSCQVFWVRSGGNAGSYLFKIRRYLLFISQTNCELRIVGFVPFKVFECLRGVEKEWKIQANNSNLFAKTIAQQIKLLFADLE